MLWPLGARALDVPRDVASQHGPSACAEGDTVEETALARTLWGAFGKNRR